MPLDAPFHHDEDTKAERAELRKLVGAVLLGLASAGLLLYAASAHAAPVFRGQSNDGKVMSLRLLNEPCAEKVKMHLAVRVPAAFMEKFKAARLTFGGRDWDSCWVEHDGYVFSIDEEGAPLQPIPRTAFREESI